jgi:long-subunit fatty acid transport protein
LESTVRSVFRQSRTTATGPARATTGRPRSFSINLNPVVGYKINEMFSVAIGPQIQYADVRLTNASVLSDYSWRNPVSGSAA